MTFLTSLAVAQVFECTNAGGVKQYAQACPAGTVQQRQVIKGGEPAPNATSPAIAAPKSLEMQEAEYRLRLKERQEKEAQAAEDKLRADEAEANCLEARTQLQAVQSGQRMQRFDPATGERIVYSDDDRVEAIERQRKAVGVWCK